MVSRLFKLDNALARISVWAFALSLVACGGGTFSAGSGAGTGGGSAGSTTNGGGSDSGGSAAAGAPAGGASGAPSGGASGGMSTAGTGGKPATGCDACAAGSYCQDGANKCRLCSDFSRLQFAAPEELATLSQSGTGRFPRAASAGTDLFYRSGADGATQIWYAATPVVGVGVALSESARIDSAPLLAPGVVQQNFFFDRLEIATNLRHIWVATWSGSQLSVAATAPAPFNAASASDFSVAVAPAAGPDGAPKVARAYWMSTRAGGTTAALVWSNMVGVAPTAPAALDVKLQAGAGTCPLLADDVTPWVNTAGTLLLFRSESVDDSCMPNDMGAFDLYAAPLSADTGLTSAPAVALSALNNTGGMSTETDPSLSQDSCTIYFASDNGTKSLALYRAARN
jgi:hypothetical protein